MRLLAWFLTCAVIDLLVFGDAQTQLLGKRRYLVKEIVVAVTGASGALYAGRLLRALLLDGNGVHLVLSKCGRYLLREE